MNAEFAAITAAAAAEAEGILGDAFTIAGDATVYSGTFGAPTVIDVPNIGGGYKRQVQVELRATRAQFSATPTPKKNLTRTSGAPFTFIIQAVNLHDPFYYYFHLTKIGA